MITFKIKQMFFDRKKVIATLTPRELSALSRIGAFIRRTAKGLIRVGKKPAKPGRPPHSHAGNLRELIYFGLDAARRSVVIGPVVFRKGEAPRLLERGGTIRRKTSPRRTRTLHYSGNPFMSPAFKKNESKIPEVWANALRGKT